MGVTAKMWQLALVGTKASKSWTYNVPVLASYCQASAASRSVPGAAAVDSVSLVRPR